MNNTHKFRRMLLEGNVAECKRLYLLRMYALDVDEAINARAEDVRRLSEAERRVDGKVPLIVSERDCDHVWAMYVAWILPTIPALRNFRLGLGEEGPATACVIPTLAEAASVKAGLRDALLEAFEDGHPHCVHE